MSVSIAGGVSWGSNRSTESRLIFVRFRSSRIFKTPASEANFDLAAGEATGGTSTLTGGGGVSTTVGFGRKRIGKTRKRMRATTDKRTAMAQSIIEEHKGKIRIFSTLGQGTDTRIELKCV
jgi:hypothetical protein